MSAQVIYNYNKIMNYAFYLLHLQSKSKNKYIYAALDIIKYSASEKL